MHRPCLLLLPALLALAACSGKEFTPVDDDSGDGGAGDVGSGDGGTGDGGSGDGGTGDGGGSDTAGGGDSGSGETVDYCHVQFPCGMALAPGATSESVYVWVYEAGRTEGEGAGAGISVEVGVGPDGSDPAAGGWDWSPARWFADKDGLSAGDLANDEHAGTFTAPGTPGTWDYAARVRVDGGPWAWCDLAANDGNGCTGAGTDDGYDPADAGALTVE